MSRRMTAIADLDDDLDIKTMFDGWPEVKTPEPVKPVLSLESAVRVLEAAGYGLLDSFEIRGTRNFLCEFGLARAAAPLITDYDLLAQHIQRVFVEAGFDMPNQNLVVALHAGGERVSVGFLAWFPGR
jgi:hypothetical protein